MKQPIYLEDRKFFVSMIALSLIALVASMVLNLAMIAYTNRALKDTYAGIVGTVVQKYPQAEAQVVQDLRSPKSNSTNLGIQVLEKYGLGDSRSADISIAIGLSARLLPVGLALVGLVCAGSMLLLIRYQRGISAQMADLSSYLRDIDAGDYSLDVRDNGEGSFSLLKNDLYKVTVRLREQAELLQKDKTALSNLIADVSHQIKTPLTSLGVLVNLLAEDPPEEDRRTFLERLRMQLGRIQWLTASVAQVSPAGRWHRGFKKRASGYTPVDRKSARPSADSA
ncbi:MAG: histidine kinase dimerization/phospho-acceptor domain-containing protein [Anaerolineales bacterium]